MRYIFTDHPSSIGETYWQHLWFALKFSAYMLLGSLACLIHGLLPFLLPKTSSGILYKLIHEFETGPRAKLLAEHKNKQD